jgi:hypothetical protein
MKKELLIEGMKCKIVKFCDDVEGALYENEVVTLLEWTTVGSTDGSPVVAYVVDGVGKHHTVGLDQIEPV